jgi:hypothetical protein
MKYLVLDELQMNGVIQIIGDAEHEVSTEEVKETCDCKGGFGRSKIVTALLLLPLQ